MRLSRAKSPTWNKRGKGISSGSRLSGGIGVVFSTDDASQGYHNTYNETLRQKPKVKFLKPPDPSATRSKSANRTPSYRRLLLRRLPSLPVVQMSAVVARLSGCADITLSFKIRGIEGHILQFVDVRLVVIKIASAGGAR